MQKKIRISESEISWRNHNEDFFKCQLYAKCGKLFIRIEYLINKFKKKLFTVGSIEATSMNSKVDANLLAYLKLAQELFRKKIMHHFNHYLAEAARKKAIRMNLQV